MPRPQKKYHYIYRTTCILTGKFYVGMHSTNNIDDGYLGSGKILRYSISKHGEANHRKEIIEMCSSREAMKLREKEIVNEELLADPLNINLKYGGEGGFDHINDGSDAHRARSRNNALKIPLVSKSKGGKASGAANLSKAHAAGKIRHDTFTGRKHSEETKQKMRDARARIKSVSKSIPP